MLRILLNECANGHPPYMQACQRLTCKCSASDPTASLALNDLNEELQVYMLEYSLPAHQ